MATCLHGSHEKPDSFYRAKPATEKERSGFEVHGGVQKQAFYL